MMPTKEEAIRQEQQHIPPKRAGMRLPRRSEEGVHIEPEPEEVRELELAGQTYQGRIDLVSCAKRRLEEQDWDRQQAAKKAAKQREAAIADEMRKQDIQKEAERRLQAQTPTPSGFQYSIDYRQITSHGLSYNLPKNPARIVAMLHGAYLKDSLSYVTGDQIRKQVNCGKVSDQFRTPDARRFWNDMIIHQGRDHYRLNLPARIDI